MLEFVLHFSNLLTFRWNEIIGGSSSTMQSLPVWFGCIEWNFQHAVMKAKLDQILNSTRRIVHLKLESLLFKERQIFQIVEAFKSSLRSLTINGCSIHLRNLTKLFRLIENLQTISLSSVSLSYFDENEVCDLKKLRVLKLYNVDMNILKLFSTCKLRSLSCEYLENVTSGYLMDFVASQQTLRSLDLSSYPEAAIFANTFDDYDRRGSGSLTSLSIYGELSSNYPIMHEEVDRSIRQVLRFAGQSLKNLEINYKLSLETANLILTELTSLRKLSVMASGFPRENTFYSQLKPSTSITKLTLSAATHIDPNFYGLDHLKLPALEELTIEDPSAICHLDRLLTNNDTIRRVKVVELIGKTKIWKDFIKHS